MDDIQSPTSQGARAAWLAPEDYAAWLAKEFASVGMELPPAKTVDVVVDLARFAGYATFVCTDSTFGMDVRFRFTGGGAVVESGSAADALRWVTAQARSMRLHLEAARHDAEALRRHV